MFSVFVNPSVTPVTALYIKDRVRPCIARCSGVSAARSTITLPSSCLTSIPRAKGTVSSPFGPLTFTLRPESSTLTAPGISTGAFPILDTTTSLVDEAKDFAADAPAPGLVVCQDALGGREYRHPEPVEHARDVGLLAVDPAARAAHSPETRDAAAAVGAVLQGYDEPPLDPAPALGDVLNVAFLPKNPGDLRLHLRVRYLDRLLLCHVRVADARQEIRYRIINRHDSLPTRFRYARDLPLVRQLPEADPAQAELPVVTLCPAAPLATVVLPDRVLLLFLLLYQQRLSRHLQPLNSAGTASRGAARAPAPLRRSPSSSRSPRRARGSRLWSRRRSRGR